jgi:hypothetical protein
MTFLLALLLRVQVQLDVNVQLPSISFEVAPAMVEIGPGVMVVHDRDDEVFYTGGWYWVRGRDGRWYRARDHRGGWVYVEPRVVPVALVRVPPGRYKRHKDKPEKWRVVNADGSVTEIRTDKHGVAEVKVKHSHKKGKKEKKGKWK